MATSKTLAPTNVTIQIPEFTDQPDQRVNSNCIDKEADAINALNTHIVKYVSVPYSDFTFNSDAHYCNHQPSYYLPSGATLIGAIAYSTNSHGACVDIRNNEFSVRPPDVTPSSSYQFVCTLLYTP